MKGAPLILLVLILPHAGQASAQYADWWGSVETLLWWTNNGPAPPPLSMPVYAGSEASIPAALDALVAPEVLGGSPISSPMQVGGRFTLGRWLPTDLWLGLEANYLFLGKTTDSHSIAAGSLVSVSNPLLEIAPGAQLPTADDLRAYGVLNDGTATLTISHQLHGAELNAVMPLSEQNGRSWQLLAGYRFLNVDEDLTFVTEQGDSGGFFAGQWLQTLDRFETRNDFHGGQLGVRGRWMRGLWFCGASLKVALGNTHEVVRIYGETTSDALTQFLSPVPLATAPGGIYAQPTNIGQFSRDRFAVLPEVELRLGLQLTPRLRTFVGYDFLYLSNVARPGNQIDPDIISTRLAGLKAEPGGALVGMTHPVPLLEGSDFWAQGINFGAELLW